MSWTMVIGGESMKGWGDYEEEPGIRTCIIPVRFGTKYHAMLLPWHASRNAVLGLTTKWHDGGDQR